MASPMDASLPQPTPIEADPWTAFLQQRCQQQGIASWRELARRGQVSLWQVQQLRRGNLLQMRLEPLRCLAQALGIGLAQLLAVGIEEGSRGEGVVLDAATLEANPEANPEAANLGTANLEAANPEAANLETVTSVNWQAECDRLQQQIDRQSQELTLEFQRQALAQLEPWLKNWPKVVQAATVTKPDLLAVKVLPLLAPLEGLLREWGLVAIGAIGETLPYDPHCHTCLGPTPAPGDPVTVQRPGYRHGTAILHRAEVAAGAEVV